MNGAPCIEDIQLDEYLEPIKRLFTTEGTENTENTEVFLVCAFAQTSLNKFFSVSSVFSVVKKNFSYKRLNYKSRAHGLRGILSLAIFRWSYQD